MHAIDDGKPGLVSRSPGDTDKLLHDIGDIVFYIGNGGCGACVTARNVVRRNVMLTQMSFATYDIILPSGQGVLGVEEWKLTPGVKWTGAYAYADVERTEPMEDYIPFHRKNTAWIGDIPWYYYDTEVMKRTMVNYGSAEFASTKKECPLCTLAPCSVEEWRAEQDSVVDGKQTCKLVSDGKVLLVNARMLRANQTTYGQLEYFFVGSKGARESVESGVQEVLDGMGARVRLVEHAGVNVPVFLFRKELGGTPLHPSSDYPYGYSSWAELYARLRYRTGLVPVRTGDSIEGATKMFSVILVDTRHVLKVPASGFALGSHGHAKPLLNDALAGVEVPGDGMEVWFSVHRKLLIDAANANKVQMQTKDGARREEISEDSNDSYIRRMMSGYARSVSDPVRVMARYAQVDDKKLAEAVQEMDRMLDRRVHLYSRMQALLYSYAATNAWHVGFRANEQVADEHALVIHLLKCEHVEDVTVVPYSIIEECVTRTWEEMYDALKNSDMMKFYPMSKKTPGVPNHKAMDAVFRKVRWSLSYEPADKDASVINNDDAVYDDDWDEDVDYALGSDAQEDRIESTEDAHRKDWNYVDMERDERLAEAEGLSYITYKDRSVDEALAHAAWMRCSEDVKINDAIHLINKTSRVKYMLDRMVDVATLPDRSMLSMQQTPTHWVSLFGSRDQIVCYFITSFMGAADGKEYGVFVEGTVHTMNAFVLDPDRETRATSVKAGVADVSQAIVEDIKQGRYKYMLMLKESPMTVSERDELMKIEQYAADKVSETLQGEVEEFVEAYRRDLAIVAPYATSNTRDVMKMNWEVSFNTVHADLYDLSNVLRQQGEEEMQVRRTVTQEPDSRNPFSQAWRSMMSSWVHTAYKGGSVLNKSHLQQMKSSIYDLWDMRDKELRIYLDSKVYTGEEKTAEDMEVMDALYKYPFYTEENYLYHHMLVMYYVQCISHSLNANTKILRMDKSKNAASVKAFSASVSFLKSSEFDEMVRLLELDEKDKVSGSKNVNRILASSRGGGVTRFMPALTSSYEKMLDDIADDIEKRRGRVNKRMEDTLVFRKQVVEHMFLSVVNPSMITFQEFINEGSVTALEVAPGESTKDDADLVKTVLEGKKIMMLYLTDYTETVGAVHGRRKNAYDYMPCPSKSTLSPYEVFALASMLESYYYVLQTATDELELLIDKTEKEHAEREEARKLVLGMLPVGYEYAEDSYLSDSANVGLAEKIRQMKDKMDRARQKGKSRAFNLSRKDKKQAGSVPNVPRERVAQALSPDEMVQMAEKNKKKRKKADISVDGEDSPAQLLRDLGLVKATGPHLDKLDYASRVRFGMWTEALYSVMVPPERHSLERLRWITDLYVKDEYFASGKYDTARVLMSMCAAMSGMDESGAYVAETIPTGSARYPMKDKTEMAEMWTLLFTDNVLGSCAWRVKDGLVDPVGGGEWAARNIEVSSFVYAAYNERGLLYTPTAAESLSSELKLAPIRDASKMFTYLANPKFGVACYFIKKENEQTPTTPTPTASLIGVSSDNGKQSGLDDMKRKYGSGHTLPSDRKNNTTPDIVTTLESAVSTQTTSGLHNRHLDSACFMNDYKFVIESMRKRIGVRDKDWTPLTTTTVSKAIDHAITIKSSCPTKSTPAWIAANTISYIINASSPKALTHVVWNDDMRRRKLKLMLMESSSTGAVIAMLMESMKHYDTYNNVMLCGPNAMAEHDHSSWWKKDVVDSAFFVVNSNETVPCNVKDMMFAKVCTEESSPMESASCKSGDTRPSLPGKRAILVDGHEDVVYVMPKPSLSESFVPYRWKNNLGANPDFCSGMLMLANAFIDNGNPEVVDLGWKHMEEAIEYFRHKHGRFPNPNLDNSKLFVCMMENSGQFVQEEYNLANCVSYIRNGMVERMWLSYGDYGSAVVVMLGRNGPWMYVSDSGKVSGMSTAGVEKILNDKNTVSVIHDYGMFYILSKWLRKGLEECAAEQKIAMRFVRRGNIVKMVYDDIRAMVLHTRSVMERKEIIGEANKLLETDSSAGYSISIILALLYSAALRLDLNPKIVYTDLKNKGAPQQFEKGDLRFLTECCSTQTPEHDAHTNKNNTRDVGKISYVHRSKDGSLKKHQREKAPTDSVLPIVLCVPCGNGKHDTS